MVSFNVKERNSSLADQVDDKLVVAKPPVADYSATLSPSTQRFEGLWTTDFLSLEGDRFMDDQGSIYPELS